MEDQTITPEPEYIKGFNEGYIMAEHLPEVAEKLAKSKNKGPRFQGFKDGRTQHLFEKISEMHFKVEKSKEKGNEMER